MGFKTLGLALLQITDHVTLSQLGALTGINCHFLLGVHDTVSGHLYGFPLTHSPGRFSAVLVNHIDLLGNSQNQYLLDKYCIEFTNHRLFPNSHFFTQTTECLKYFTDNSIFFNNIQATLERRINIYKSCSQNIGIGPIALRQIGDFIVIHFPVK